MEFIILEGRDNVGKSFLAKILKKRIDAEYIAYPYGNYSDRKEMEKNMVFWKGKSFEKHNNAVDSEIQDMLETTEKNYIIFDRSWLSFVVYNNGYYKDSFPRIKKKLILLGNDEHYRECVKILFPLYFEIEAIPKEETIEAVVDFIIN